jgi:hypothetical protein
MNAAFVLKALIEKVGMAHRNFRGLTGWAMFRMKPNSTEFALQIKVALAQKSQRDCLVCRYVKCSVQKIRYAVNNRGLIKLCCQTWGFHGVKVPKAWHPGLHYWCAPGLE